MSQNLSSAAVVIGAISVKPYVYLLVAHTDNLWYPDHALQNAGSDLDSKLFDTLIKLVQESLENVSFD